MKKLLTLTLLLTTLAFTGCGSSSTQSVAPTTNDSNNPTIQRAVVEPSEYDIVAEDKFPAKYSEYESEKSSVEVFYSDIDENVQEFKNRYQALTGKSFEGDFDGSMIVAKTGVKNNSGYSIKVENIEDTGRYTQVHLAVVKTKGCLVNQTITSPYTIAFVPNHKEVRFTIQERVVECK